MSTIRLTSIDISVPKYEWVEVPVEFKTGWKVYRLGIDLDTNKYMSINEYTQQFDEAIAEDKKVLDELKSLGDIDHIIQTEYNGSLNSFCKSFYCKKYNIKINSMMNAMRIENSADRLERFLEKFDSLSSNEFQTYELKCVITRIAQRIKFMHEERNFYAEEDAMVHLANQYLTQHSKNGIKTPKLLRIKGISCDIISKNDSTQKSSLDIVVPTYEWVDVPVLFKTPLDTVSILAEVNKDKVLIERVKSLGDINDIITNKHQGSLGQFCKAIFRKTFPNSPTNIVLDKSSKLENFLSKFDRLSNREFQDFKFTYSVIESCKKVKFNTESTFFNSENDLLLDFSRKSIPENFEIIKTSKYKVTVLSLLI